jgi:hypothetical protein
MAHRANGDYVFQVDAGPGKRVFVGIDKDDNLVNVVKASALPPEYAGLQQLRSATRSWSRSASGRTILVGRTGRGIGGILMPIGAAAGGAIGGRKASKKSNPGEGMTEAELTRRLKF